MTEDQLLKAVIRLAQALGWRCYHQRAGKTSGGNWARTTEGDPGFPDLVLAHPGLGMLLFVELKSSTGRLRPEQKEWRDVLSSLVTLDIGFGLPAIPVARWFLWRPQDWSDGVVERVLRGEAA